MLQDAAAVAVLRRCAATIAVHKGLSACGSTAGTCDGLVLLGSLSLFLSFPCPASVVACVLLCMLLLCVLRWSCPFEYADLSSRYNFCNCCEDCFQNIITCKCCLPGFLGKIYKSVCGEFPFTEDVNQVQLTISAFSMPPGPPHSSIRWFCANFVLLLL